MDKKKETKIAFNKEGKVYTIVGKDGKKRIVTIEVDKKNKEKGKDNEGK